MTKHFLVFILLSLFYIMPFFGSAQSVRDQKMAEKVGNKLENFGPFFKEYEALGKFNLDSISVHREDTIIELFFNDKVSYIPLRESTIAIEKYRISSFLGRTFRKYNLILYSGPIDLADLVPNYYRIEIPIDSSHFIKDDQTKMLFRRPDEFIFSDGLYGKHIALWHSHGRYYESSLDRWEWQRARLHTTVEDLLPMSFVLPYLAPMLENSGAITLIPRERDIQRHEVIIDNDQPNQNGELILNIDQFSFEKIEGAGFRWKDIYIANENPFHLGSHLVARAKSYPEREDSIWVARYIADFPADGRYALYISYGKNNAMVSAPLYRVKSLNGTDIISVDQTMGAGTWIYMGHYDFQKGKDPLKGSVELISLDPASITTIDAIKLGGGIGNIARPPSAGIEKETDGWTTSNSPRYMEAARYFLQYSGMPDSLVYNLNKSKHDYKDDYQGRGEWVNYLVGKPKGISEKDTIDGLGIPIDLSFAFHTDAGVSTNDTIIGTLGIYSDGQEEKQFPNGRSKKVNRELTDIIQSQIVADIKHTFHPKWNRRGIWNKAYSEAYRANVPTMLLELLSHQNLSDMNYGLDPRFRFLVSRAIYKGMLRFLAYQENRDYIVQPLPVDHFNIQRISGKTIRLVWKAVEDPLEPTAIPDHYKIYLREADGAFTLLEKNYIGEYYDWEVPEYGKIYSFQIVAENTGGKSFPGEILSVGLLENQDSLALIVNGFDRICGPAIVDQGDFAGIAYWQDQGVPDRYDISTTGMPYDFNRNSPWLDDDSPGWGASHSDLEGRVIPGNSFDFPFIHGKAILANGQSFISTSDEYYCSNDFNLKNIIFVDLIMGEEKTTKNFKDSLSSYTIYTPEMMAQLENTLDNKIPVFLSGAYIGTDLEISGDTTSIQFAREKLHFVWRSNHADRMGWVYGTRAIPAFQEFNLSYNAGQHPDHYTVEAPDAIEPASNSAFIFLRYKSSNASAAIAYKGNPGIVVMGFPFESVLSASTRKQLMGKIISFLKETKGP